MRTCFALLFLSALALPAQPKIDWAKVNEEGLHHFQAIVQIDTTDPPGNETRVVEYVKKVLEAEGILTIHPRSGIQFVKPGLELTRSTYQFRGIVERAAVAVFAETADDDELREIERRHVELARLIAAEGLTAPARIEIEALEQLLHNAIIASLNNPLIETSYKRMHNYLRLVRLDRKLTAPLALRSVREHMEIILACKARDPEKASAAPSAHFTAALQRHMGMY